MYVNVGNDHAIEGFREEGSESVMYRTVPGERVTSFTFPEGMGLQEAFSAVTTALGHHIEPGESPAWVESDSPGLSTLLMEHYSLSTKRNGRPATWGKKG